MKIIPQLSKLLLLIVFCLFIACSNDDNGSPEVDDEIENTDTEDEESTENEEENDVEEGTTTDGSVVDYIVGAENLTQLEEAVITAGLVEALNAEGPFTIFAPTDEAAANLFDLLGDNYSSFADFDTFVEKQLLELILSYHVVPGNYPSKELVEGALTTLVPDENIEIIAAGDSFVIGDASAVDATIIGVDNIANNGVVHLIDKILIPQEVQEFLESLGIDSGGNLPTITELVGANEDLEFLYQALELTGLLETLDSEGPFTVFAPSNETLLFVAGIFGNSIEDIQSFDTEEEIELLRNVLLYHVVEGTVSSTDLASGEITTLLGDVISVAETAEGFVLKDALNTNYEEANLEIDVEINLNVNFVVTDIPAANGVIHIVDRVLVPQSVIDTVLSETENSLAELLENEMFIAAYYMVRGDFVETFENSEEFTLFIPTNQAFLSLFEELDGIDSLADFDTEEELELLSTILSYHLIRNIKATASVLQDGQQIETLQGEELTISLTNGVSILDKSGKAATVTSADILVGNGVIHFIDKVLLPQAVLDSL
ncbi:hypothetical protein GCM10011414_27940 [Croceivirga lutea]|uniref:fasciclin domain-containing protein n=1 Tax=Croceivirga lutea TaxID=1775167 RepID=UPI00163ABF6A|nr:fasciclin domain-containing protein [Croceivirga lutea]GGG56511.1 hypothetical protein GCM10011414_27940 [Croceivirga lutea]